MSNKTTLHKQKAFLSPIDKALFKQKYKAARDHYGNYMDKILKVTGGKVIYDYDEFIKR
jgi:hypothetical protein